MSSIPEDFTASVTNWKGTRTIHSSVQEILSEAQGLASQVIGQVNNAMNAMESSGDRALMDAIAAIDALGHFSPMAINVDYSPPEFKNPGFLEPGMLTGMDTPANPVGPKDLDPISMQVYDPPAPVFKGKAPVIGQVTFGSPPPMQTFYEPPAPLVGDVKAVGQPPPMSFTEFTADMPLPPALRALVLPTFVPQPFPDYTPIGSTEPPQPPGAGDIDINLDDLVDYARIWGDEIIKAAPQLGGVLVRDLVTERDIRNTVETFRLRGCPLDNVQEMAEIDYGRESRRLLNQAESRQLLIDEGLLGAETKRLSLGFAIKYEAMLIELTIAVSKLYFEALTARAEAQLSLAKALTSYFNALVAEYAADADLYKLYIEEEVAKLKYWEALVQAEIAKTKANEQMAKLYVETEQIETIEADVYQAQVGTVMAQAERYRAQIEAIAAKAEVAKTGITVYRGQTDAYAAQVAAYKGHFDAYAATTKSVSAQNQAQQATSEISLADAQRAAAEAGIISTNIEVASEQLKAQAMKIASSYESAKLTNTIESSKAQIASSRSRITSLKYASDRQLTEVTNEAVSNYANQAGRYYNQASDAAYRASEQTLKAITAATQAAAIAQEAAGKTSSALSQGAYSAVHISAGLQGSGSLTGGEQHSANLEQQISDMLTYTESKSETVSA